MILIADSGSTKTQWILIDKQSVLTEIYTPGINPFFQSQDDIAKMLDDQLLPKLKSDSINKISKRKKNKKIKLCKPIFLDNSPI